MSGGVTPEMLEGLSPLRELDAEALRLLADEAEIEVYGARSVIYRAGTSDDWTRYVLSGEVILIDGEGSHQRSVVGTGDNAIAEEPLGRELPHPTHALARTETKLICLSTQRVDQLLSDHRLPEYEVGQVGGESTGESLFSGLISDLMQDRLELPSMPDIAVRVRQAVSDPDAGAPEVGKILQADPVVAAELLKAANSALYAGHSSVDSLNSAIVRLGLRNVRELVTAVTLRQVFKTSHPMLNKRMVELWMHSTLVAAIASVLARRLKGFDPERALLAGLIHDIGVVPLLAHAGDYADLAADQNALEEVIAQYRGDIGSMILRRWNFPEEMVAVALDAEDWEREHDGGGDYADLVIAAQLQSYSGSPDAARYPSLDTLPLSTRLGLAEVGVTDSAPILDEAREDIANVQRFLTG